MEFESFSEKLHAIFANDPELNKVTLEQILQSIPRVDQLSGIAHGQAVLVRTDIDAPIKEGKVVDMSRIEASAETIKFCREKGWKTVIFGHVGRDKTNTALPVCQAMADYVGFPIEFVEDWLDETNCRLVDSFVELVQSAPAGTVFMLENTRKFDLERALWKAKEEQFPDIAKKMFLVVTDIAQRLTTVEINEAIAASNMDFSSVAIPLLMSKTAMGFEIAEELKNHIRGARQSSLVVFSGLKIDKLDDLEGIVDRGALKMIIAAGSLAMALMKAKAQMDGSDFFLGLAETDSTQKAFIEPKRIEQAKRIVRKCSEQKIDLVLPVDFVLNTGEVSKIIGEGQAQLDIGPESCSLIASKIRAFIQTSKASGAPAAMFFNGVFGKFEDEKFEAGTKTFIPLLKEMTEAGVRTYVGGGEGRMALLKYGSVSDVTHAFTCGGTVLKSLTNKHIAYLKAMYLQNSQG